MEGYVGTEGVLFITYLPYLGQPAPKVVEQTEYIVRPYGC